jgi:hypothetical protein
VKGVIDMRITHAEMCAAVQVWLNKHLMSSSVRPVVKVRQSRDKQSFVIVFSK